MTEDEHLTEVAVSLVDAKHHLEAAETISVRDRVHPIYKDAIRTVMNLLTNAENIVNSWRREIEEESEKCLPTEQRVPKDCRQSMRSE